MSWASRRGTPAASAPQACSSLYVANSCGETKLRPKPTRWPCAVRIGCYLGAGVGHPAAPFDVRSRFCRRSARTIERLDAGPDQPTGRCRIWFLADSLWVEESSGELERK